MREFVLALLLCPIFFARCSAEDLTDRLGEISGAYQIQQLLPEDVRDISGELRLDGRYDTEGALHRLWERFVGKLTEQWSASLHAAAEIFLLALLCALAECFCSSKEIRETIDRAGCCAVSILVSGSLAEMLAQATDSVSRLATFSHAILPALFTAAAADPTSRTGTQPNGVCSKA